MKQFLFLTLFSFLMFDGICIKGAMGEKITYEQLLSKFQQKTSDPLFETNFKPLFSLCETDVASKYINVLNSIYNPNFQNPMDKSNLNDLCTSIGSSLQGYATYLQPVEDEIQELYNNWENHDLTVAEEGRVIFRFSQIKRVHASFNKAFKTAMDQLSKRVASFMKESGNGQAQTAKSYAKSQAAILKDLETANEVLLKFCNRRMDWAKLLLGTDIEIGPIFK
ncbi:uncharacterized protein LOC116348958 [Contarinia nasturtii]|uniref:uncharacterized protein LOC116348958 n=1 Tax=Contarinia nasturtii TaxID=265458 RepID=UPI0012D44187|nr:uncharacterized protein LOC116348958 [Contarinia nasturtii]